MTKNKENKIIDLLKSGDFTLAYHDRGSCTLYKGKHEYGEWKSKDLVYDFDGSDSYGYMPSEIELLVQALGGNCDSI